MICRNQKVDVKVTKFPCMTCVTCIFRYPAIAQKKGRVRVSVLCPFSRAVLPLSSHPEKARWIQRAQNTQKWVKDFFPLFIWFRSWGPSSNDVCAGFGKGYTTLWMGGCVDVILRRGAKIPENVVDVICTWTPAAWQGPFSGPLLRKIRRGSGRRRSRLAQCQEARRPSPPTLGRRGCFIL